MAFETHSLVHSAQSTVTVRHVRRAVAVETGISMSINVGIALSGPLSKLARGSSLHHPQSFSLTDVLPFLIMCALMSAIMPAWLTRRRHHRGQLPPLASVGVPHKGRVVASALVAVALWMIVVPPITLALLIKAAPDPWGGLYVPTIKAVYGLGAAAILTPGTLAILYLPFWPRAHRSSERA